MYRSLTLDAFYISKFSLGTQSYNQDNRIIIKNSRIGALTIGNDIDLELQNTFVGKLVLVTGSLKRFTMYGGGVSQLEVSPSSTPFRGSVWFSNTWFPTDKHLPDKAQPYRNMRHHLRDLGNVRMADLFHVLELKTERQDESWTNKTFSWLYENFSEYGSSILRPIRLLLLLGILVSLILIFFDGAVVTDALKQDASGWRTALLGDDCYARVLRGFYLSFYFIFHPLGLGEQPVLIASRPWLAGLLVIEGILSVTLITLTIFALRRRFKLQQA
jgi:hypothetical protein